MTVAQSVDEPIHGRMTGNEALARILLKQAIQNESRDAIVEILDRIEGKASKGATVKPTNDALNEALDVSIDSLNTLTEGMMK